MTINKLTIKNGIIQDKNIDGIPLKVQIIKPSGIKNVRTLIKMNNILGITNHNTDNTSPSAGDEAHAKWLQNVENADKQYVGAHLFVDHDSITQVLPLNEVAYHAGDGKGNGNYRTIGVEICVNKNIKQAEVNAQKLNAALIKTYPNLKVYKHQDWSGKYCPSTILSSKNGWSDFVKGINSYLNKPSINKNYLGIGDKGSDVKKLQSDLIELGYSFGKYGADGSFGPATVETVKKFQKDNKLKIDGFAGPATQAKIKKLLAKKTNVNSKTYFRVVAGSYKDRKNADDMVEKLKNQNINAFILPYEV